MTRGRRYAFVVLAIATICLATSCAVPSNPGDNNGQAGTVAGESNGFFNASDVWLIASSTAYIGGYGATTDFVINATDTDSCIGIAPPVTLTFDGTTLSVSSSFTDINMPRTCSVNLSAGASSCASSGATAPGAECNLTNATGTSVVGSSMGDIADGRVVRFDACTNPPTDFASLGDWAILNLHVLELGGANSVGQLGALITLGGTGDTVQLGSVLTEASASSAVGCVDETPSGPITLTDGRLSIDFTMEGQDNSQGVGTPGTCTLTFDGDMAYCAVYDLSLVTGATGSVDITRFDGTGTWMTPDASGTVTTLYLTTNLSGGSVAFPVVRR